MVPRPTTRLVFRQLTLDDLDFVAAMLGHPEVMRYYRQTYSREEALLWIERQRDRYRRDGHALWLVSGRETGEPIGQVGLVQQQVDDGLEPEIGFLVHRPYWRQGYATEAALRVRDFAFDELDLPRVVSLIRPENKPSQGVARKLGMSPERETTFAGFQHLVFSVSRPGPG